MKYSFILAALLSVASLAADETVTKREVVSTPSNITIVCQKEECKKNQVQKSAPAPQAPQNVLTAKKNVLISVVGQGVAPVNTSSPAQAYALAKRAAVADAYRLIAEKVKGVRIDGQDLVKDMMVKRSTVRTSVQAMVRNANIVETTFKEGLCEVEMEITLSRSQFPQ